MWAGYRKVAIAGLIALALGASACSAAKHQVAGPATTTSTAARSATTVAAPPTTTHAAPPTTATAPPATLPARPDVTLFAGKWYLHGAFVTVNRDGSGSGMWRTYRFCSEDPTPPCDKTQPNGNEVDIIDGGHAQFHVVSVNRYAATFEVTQSTQPSFIPNGRVQFLLHKHDELTIGSTGPFCGPHAPEMACGM